MESKGTQCMKLTQASISAYKPIRAYTNWVQQGLACCTVVDSHLHGALSRFARSRLCGCSSSLSVAGIWVHICMVHSPLRTFSPPATFCDRSHAPSAIARTSQSLTRTLCNRPHHPSVVYCNPHKEITIKHQRISMDNNAWMYV